MAQDHGNEAFVLHLFQLLEEAVSSTSSYKSSLSQNLDTYRQMPSFNQNLVYFLATDGPISLSNGQQRSMSAEARSLSGLLLKNNFALCDERKGFGMSFWAPQFPYIQEGLLRALNSSSSRVQSTASSAVSMFVYVFSLNQWPSLLSHLAKIVDDRDSNSAESAMSAFCKISEDCSYELAYTISQQDSLNVMLMKLLHWSDSLPMHLSKYALNALNEFIPHRPAILGQNLTPMLGSLSRQANEAMRIKQSEESLEYLKIICRTIVLLFSSFTEEMITSLPSIMEFMYNLLGSANGDETGISQEACEFWLAVSHHVDAIDKSLMDSFYPRLIPLLLSKMIYADDDPIFIDYAEYEGTGNVPYEGSDSESDIKPRHHIAKESIKTDSKDKSMQQIENASDADEDSDTDDDDDTEGAYDWNLRKCSASTLDSFSGWFSNDIVTHVLFPSLMQYLQSDNWKHREVGILALGAIGHHCFDHLEPSMKDLFPLLCHSLRDNFPLVRSISCWTLSRFSEWVGTSHFGKSYWEHALSGLLENASILTNKRVQGASMSSLAVFFEDLPSHTYIVPFAELICTRLGSCFLKTQKKNKLALLDTLTALGSALENYAETCTVSSVQSIVPHLLNLLDSTSEFNQEIFPLLECLSSILLYFQFWLKSDPSTLKMLFSTSWTYLSNALSLEDGSDEAAEMHDLAVASLELISVLAQICGNLFSDLLNREDWKSIFSAACTRKSPSIRQSVFALLGDLARSQPDFTRANLSVLLIQLAPILDLNLIPSPNTHTNISLGQNLARPQNVATPSGSGSSDMEVTLSVSNNIIWYLGELAGALPTAAGDQDQFIHLSLNKHFLPKLIYLLRQGSGPLHLPGPFMHNLAITLGRLSGLAPSLLSKHLLFSSTSGESNNEGANLQAWQHAIADGPFNAEGVPLGDRGDLVSAFLGVSLAIQAALKKEVLQNSNGLSLSTGSETVSTIPSKLLSTWLFIVVLGYSGPHSAQLDDVQKGTAAAIRAAMDPADWHSLQMHIPAHLASRVPV